MQSLHLHGLNDGGIPFSGVVLDPGGNVYGTASVGGKGGNGVIFKIEAAN
jgi:uncharacterized repeat protein (TIGR03803 family)